MICRLPRPLPSPVGKISRVKGGVRSCAGRRKLFDPGGQGRKESCPRTCAGACARPCAQASGRAACSSPPALPPVLPQFQGRFPAVAAMAQALQICPVCELAPVSAMGLDVVHIRGPHPEPPLGARPAERLLQELRRLQVLGPFVGLVHPAPGLSLLAAPVPILGTVGIAVPIRDQDSASGMAARSERLIGHGLSPPGKTKSRHRRLPAWEVIGTG